MLGQLLPEAMVAYLDNHGPEKFATIFLGSTTARGDLVQRDEAADDPEDRPPPGRLPSLSPCSKPSCSVIFTI